MDKILYDGSGLFEVLFHVLEERDTFLFTTIVSLTKLVVHVLPWQPVCLIKEDLLAT